LKQVREREHTCRDGRSLRVIIDRIPRLCQPAAHPTAEWLANQLMEACGWEPVPDLLIRDRDANYGEVFVRRVRSLRIRDQPISPRSPWQNGCAEKLIGSIRRECLDHVVVIRESHLRHVLLSYMEYYDGARTHLSVMHTPDCTGRPNGRSAQTILGGLHNQYARI
jgi:transposase InsO family protein